MITFDNFFVCVIITIAIILGNSAFDLHLIIKRIKYSPTHALMSMIRQKNIYDILYINLRRRTFLRNSWDRFLRLS